MMFQFFPGNYMWSQAIFRVLFTGGAIGEVARAVSVLSEGDPNDPDSWHQVWQQLGDQLYERAVSQHDSGSRISARGSFLRSCAYYQWSIAFMDHSDRRRRDVHRRSLEAFSRFAELHAPPIMRVEVPYEEVSYPAWFVPPAGPARQSAVAVYLPGWDSTKEQGIVLALGLAERGVGVLLCDGPGIGEAVLFRDLVNRHDYEVPGTAAFDYLLTRPDVDPSRIAVVGSSLGGYRAARMAAYEHRLAAAVIWGAVWDFGRVWESRREKADEALPTTASHALHVMGLADLESVSASLKQWTLDGVAERIKCPLLIVHGAADSQFPLSDAHKLHESAGSLEKTLKVFTQDEGGAAHCQNDNRILAHDYIGDWLATVLGE